MKRTLLSFLVALALLTSCYDDDKLWKAVNDQQERIEALESWQTVVNSNIEALQVLVSGQDYITDVIPIVLANDTIGYTIAFNDHAPVSLYNGKKGDRGDKGDKGDQGTMPVISLTQQPDGNWYWTLNGELMTGSDGKPVRANGQNGEDGKPGQNAPKPMLKTGQALTAEGVTGTWTPDALYLSVDNGTTWAKVSGDDGTDGTDGDTKFTSVDDTKDDYVTFFLADGTEIKVLRYKGASLKLFSPTETGPWEVGEHRAIRYEMTYPQTSTYHIEVMAPKGWKAELDELNSWVYLTAPGERDLSVADYTGKLIVMLNVDDNPSIIRTLDVQLTDTLVVELGGDVAELLVGHGYKGTSLVLTGAMTISNDDFDALKANTTIKYLDMKKVNIKAGEIIGEPQKLPVSAFRFNRTLERIILPENLEAIGDSAFCECLSLQEIEIPANVKVIPPKAFSGCENLEKVILPEGLEEIQGRESNKGLWSMLYQGAFAGCENLREINIPSTCTKIGAEAFYMSGTFRGENELKIAKGVTLYYQSFCRYNGMTKLILNTDLSEKFADDKPPKEIFRECGNLKEVIIGDSLTHTPGEQDEFRGCPNLETVTFPATFKEIRKGMFRDCKNLKSVFWPMENTDNITIELDNGKSPFDGSGDTFKIYVPAQYVEQMKTKFDFLADHFAPIEE